LGSVLVSSLVTTSQPASTAARKPARTVFLATGLPGVPSVSQIVDKLGKMFLPSASAYLNAHKTAAEADNPKRARA
jgi:hypothetical protein